MVDAGSGAPVKIRSLFGQGRPLFSFEFFPPKTDAGMVKLEQTLRELTDLRPAFVSMTWGAGGSTRERTVELTARIQREMGLLAMAHFTCVGAPRADVVAVMDRLIE